MQTDIFLITPPFTQLNTPYPATAYLKGFLNTKQIQATQADIGIEVILEIFSSTGLQNIFDTINDKFNLSNVFSDNTNTIFSQNSLRIFALKSDYLKTIDHVIAFLQGQNPTLALQICSGNYLPEAARFAQIDDLDITFGSMGTQDKAKHLATLYLEDLSDFIVECVDSNFGFSRYAERLGRSANSFDDLYIALNQECTYIDEITLSILDSKIEKIKPKLLLISVPFPGNLYAAFRCAQFVKKHYPEIKISMGGGFPNTELRSLSDARVFEFFDFITLDDGELPVELIYEFIVKHRDINLIENLDRDDNQEYSYHFKRTFILENKKVIYLNNSPRQDYKQAQVGTPDYSDLQLDKYISVIEVVNPMHRMWSDGRWNKLTMAHGCYWGKCTFCDISLDYIKLYEPVAARLIVDRIVELTNSTRQNGFHFVDEAAPPALMREVALEILRRKITVTWWTNIRFEKNFSLDLCILLKESGCIAVSGGLEVASDRLLKLIDKGVTVEQVAQVTRNFTEAGIMVHAYLMYGYPTQTVQETIDSLEMVRQLFEIGIVQSGFWHQFAMTAHSPVGIHPDIFGVEPIGLNKDKLPLGSDHGLFANNDINFIDKTGIDHDKFSFGLKKSLYNYMHGICFEYNLQDWFDFKIPRTKISETFIEDALNQENNFNIKPSAKIIWIGGRPIINYSTKTKKGNTYEMLNLIFHDKKETFSIQTNKFEGEWLIKILEEITVESSKIYTYGELKSDFENSLDDFELFWFSKSIKTLREYGLLVL